MGRAVGCPLAGKLTDILARRGLSRTAMLMGWLALAIALLAFLSTGVTAFWPLAAVTVLLGMSVNLFSLVAAAISETYGSQRTASVVSFANTMGQLSGATVLAVSGYVGISLNTQPGNALTDTGASGFRGWLAWRSWWYWERRSTSPPSRMGSRPAASVPHTVPTGA